VTESPTAAHYALLYCPPPRQAALRALLGLRRELNAGLRAGIDHQVAHTRLAWWQEECLRAHRGAAVHPLMREFSAATHTYAGAWPDLRGWIRAAALDLAHAPLATPAEREEYADAASGTLLAALAQLLGVDANTCALARQSGTHLGLLELSASLQDHQAIRVDYALLQQSLTRLPATLQPQLRALLVWVAMAANAAVAPTPAPTTQLSLSLRRAFAQNILAWRSARDAARQSFHLRAWQEDP
jgi:hypothetical protein